MQIIKFDAPFFNPVLNGIKTQTIRFGKRFYPLGNAIAEFPNGAQLYIVIKSVTVKQFSEVTQEEVVKDGFQDKEQLHQALLSYYQMQDDTIVTLVEFEVSKTT